MKLFGSIDRIGETGEELSASSGSETCLKWPKRKSDVLKLSEFTVKSAVARCAAGIMRGNGSYVPRFREIFV